MGWISKAWKKYVYNPIKKITKKVIKGVGDFFSGAANFVGSLFGWNMAPDPGQNSIEQQQGTVLTKQGGDHIIPLYYGMGRDRDGIQTGGSLVHMSTSGTDNKFLHLTYVLGYGEAQAITVADNQWEKNGPGTGTVGFSCIWGGGSNSSGPLNYGDGNDFYTTGSILTPSGHGDTNHMEEDIYHALNSRSYGKILYHNGGFETSDSGNYNTTWHNDKAHYRGLVFVKIRLEWPTDLDTDKYVTPFNGMPKFTFYVQRESQHRLNKTLSQHPVNILYDLLRNKTYGLGINSIYVDSTSFTEMLGDVRGNPPYYGLTQYVEAIRFDIGQPVVANIKSLLYAMGCTLIWRENKFFLKPSQNFAASGVVSGSRMTALNITTHTIAEADCIGGISYETPPENEKFKVYTAKTLGQEITFEDTRTIDTSETWYSGLSGYIRSRIDLNATAKKDETLVGMCNTRLPDTKMLESHYGSTISLALGAKHSNIEVYDIIDVTYARANLSSAKYVVLDVEHTSLETVNIRAIRYLYDNDAEGVSTRDLITKTGGNILFEIVYRNNNKPLISVPTGYGIDSNTQVDQFMPNERIPNKLESLKITTSPEFFRQYIDNKGRPTNSNRVKVEWAVSGDPNNTKYSVQLKKEGDRNFTVVTVTDTQETFIDGLEDLAIYYVRVVPKNQAGYGVGRVNRFTSLDSSGPDVTNANKEFLVTDENGEGDGVLTTGSSPEFDVFTDAVNLFHSSYTNRTNRPLGHTWDNFAQPGDASYEETYKQLLATNGLGKVWNDLDWAENGGAGSRTDGYAKITTGQMSPDYTDSNYPAANENSFNNRIGYWGGTAWSDLETYRETNGFDAYLGGTTFFDCLWMTNPTSRSNVLGITVVPSMLGGTEDTGVASSDAWFEGKVEVAPDTTTSGAKGTSSNNIFYTQPNAFVYMYSSDTNDNITTFPWYGFGVSAATSVPLTGWNTEAGDDRVYRSSHVSFNPQTMAGAGSSWYGSSYSGDSKALPINAGRYVTPVIMFPDARFFGVRSYNFKIKTEQFSHTFKGVDTSGLSGSSAARTYSWTNPRFGRIKSVIISTNNSSSVDIVGYLTADPVDNTQSITFKCVNTQNGNDTNDIVDITLTGYPEVKHIAHTDIDGNTKYIEYKSNFEGTL